MDNVLGVTVLITNGHNGRRKGGVSGKGGVCGGLTRIRAV